LANPKIVGQMSITIDDFAKVEIKIGKVVSVDDIPAARKPMYKLTVDLGDGITKQCVAGIKGAYSPEKLAGKTVVAVVNLQPKPVAGVMSECMLLAAFNESELSLLAPDKELPPGTKVA
jgi:methionine--tRNA ligase beta chain